MSQVKTMSVIEETLKLGQSIWYDGLLPPQELERMIHHDHLRGATTNPVIFEKELAGGVYDGKIKELKVHGAGVDEIYKTLASGAVQAICDVFAPVYQKTRAHDGYVSIEVSPHLAYDPQATEAEAKELYRRVNRKNVMIKIPATEACLPAIEAVIAEGIPVNVTLIFSVQRHRDVMEAYINGIERRVQKGQAVQEVASVASFFVSRVDAAIDKALEEKIGAATDPLQKKLFHSLLGQVAVANSKAAYREFEEVFSSERFRALKSSGAQAQRPLWASTGTKNPNYRDVLYVESLIGPNTVDTVPPATLDAYRDHGKAELTLTEGVEEAQEILKRLDFTGISLFDQTKELERAGVQLFCEAYDKIINRIKEK